MTMTDIPTQIQTSSLESVRMEDEPNSVLQTSPDTLADWENRF